VNYEKGKRPWNYPDDWLVTLCVRCRDSIEESIKRFRRDLVAPFMAKEPERACAPQQQMEERYSPEAMRPVSIEEARRNFAALRAKLGM
jgi:hypothetical protein